MQAIDLKPISPATLLANISINFTIYSFLTNMGWWPCQAPLLLACHLFCSQSQASIQMSEAVLFDHKLFSKPLLIEGILGKHTFAADGQ